MNIKNDALATGFVTLKVQVRGRLSAKEFRDNSLLMDWAVSQLLEDKYVSVSLIDDELELSDFDYNPENE